MLASEIHSSSYSADWYALNILLILGLTPIVLAPNGRNKN